MKPLLVATLLIAGSATGLAAAETDLPAQIEFTQHVEPILRRHCFGCHSHASGQMEGGLALDWKSGWETGGGRGPAIVPGAPESSLLLRAVRHTDPDLKMPEEPLSPRDVAVLEAWIRTGATDPRTIRPMVETATDWWSLRPLQRPEVPAGVATHPIDAFIQSKLTAKGLSPTPPAGRRTLLRRLMFDLHGLPPSPEQLSEFEGDASPEAISALVNRLLDQPQYGERWARHWLDTVHFADSHGFEHDVFRPHAWRYRDYVIQSFNRDTPWAQRIREQLAADVFYPDDSPLRAALGFLGAGTYDISAAATAPQSFEYLDRDDLVTQVMGAFTSTTANCARCHAHKFDPITQADYFALQAVFAGLTKGDVPFDANPEIARQRRRWRDLQTAAEQGTSEVLLAAENTALVAAWESSRRATPDWTPWSPGSFVSLEGATFRRLPDQSIISEGTRPLTETAVLSGPAPLTRMTAIRLEVLADEMFPARGPGRADNGNLHLNEFEISVQQPSTQLSQRVAIRTATADFDQEGWTILHAIDGNPKTAWAIFPQVGQNHQAVLELTEPLTLEPGAQLSIVLKQIHGGAHILGRWRISFSDADAQSLLPLPAEIESVLSVAPAERTAAQTLALSSRVLRAVAARELRSLPPADLVFAAAAQAANERGMVQLASPREIRLLKRGDLNQPGDVVGPGALSALTHLPARFELPATAPESARRAALAEWLTHPDNPLTWRSIANRVWHYHFGRGLCDTPNDFGRMGGAPSHPELLDWLACELREHGGSLKHLHRLICTSETYLQSSAATDEQLARDPDNRWWGRRSRLRLDADSYRDAVLVVSGQLNPTMGGPGIAYFSSKPGPQATPVLDYNDFDWNLPEAGRRSIYRVVWRGIADPFMDALDFPDMGLLAPTRSFSASPLQSLVLLNHRFVLHFTNKLAQRAEQIASSPEAQVRQLTQWTWLREPTPQELELLQNLRTNHGTAAVCRLLLNSNEFLFVD